MQFLPNFFGLTRTGLDKSLYNELHIIQTPVAAIAQAPEGDLPGNEKAWTEIINECIFDSEIKQAAREMMARQIPQPPTLGFELANPAGTVVAEAEMAWPDLKIVFLSPEQANFKRIFSAMGWKTFDALNPLTLSPFEGRLPQ
jgi:DEAD/DEAH box helicase domain-containing protein